MKSKMVGLFAVVLIALMVAGFAYAHWTETLVISGTVKTGKLDLAWSCDCSDNDDGDKDVGEVECKIKDDTLTIKVKNAYPCYKVNGTIDIKNTGTVPAVLKGYRITKPDEILVRHVGGDNYMLYYDANSNGQAEDNELAATLSLKFDTVFNPPRDVQIDAGQTTYIGFTIHFTNPGLPENWSGEFKIELYFINWSPPS